MLSFMEQNVIRKVCKIVGGQAALARLLNVATPTVNQWVVGKRRIPAERCPTIERLVDRKVRCEEMRPDVDWAFLRGTSAEVEHAVS